MRLKEPYEEWSVRKHVRQDDVQESYTTGEMKMPENNKRELIDTGTDKRYVRRDKEGQFKESDDVGKSSSQDQKREAETVAKPGQGDRGDRKG